jgi:hypothetical protein
MDDIAILEGEIQETLKDVHDLIRLLNSLEKTMQQQTGDNRPQWELKEK